LAGIQLRDDLQTISRVEFRITQLTQTRFWLTLKDMTTDKDMTTEDKWIFVAAAALVVLVVLLLTGHLHIFGHAHHFWRR